MIKFANPLVKKVFIACNKNLILDDVKNNLNSYFKNDADYFNFHINLKIDEKYSELNNHIHEITDYSRKFRVTHDKSYPEIYIHINIELVSVCLLNCIKSIDKYNPHITVCILLDETRNKSKKAEILAAELFEVMPDDINIDLVFFIDLDFNTFNDMCELVIDITSFLKSYEHIRVFYDISPKINLDGVQNALDSILAYIPILKNHNVHFLECGYIYRILKFIMNYKYHSNNLNVVYSFQCGLLSNGLSPDHTVECRYFNCEYPLIKKCYPCNFLVYCSGCLSNQEQVICNFYLIFSNLLNKLEENKIEIDQFINSKKEKIEILYSDWNYQYDSFENL